MSNDGRREEERDQQGQPPDPEQTGSGSGLTEEFARIEAEIERDLAAGQQAGDREQGGEQDEAGEGPAPSPDDAPGRPGEDTVESDVLALGGEDQAEPPVETQPPAAPAEEPVESAEQGAEPPQRDQQEPDPVEAATDVEEEPEPVEAAEEPVEAAEEPVEAAEEPVEAEPEEPVTAGREQEHPVIRPMPGRPVAVEAAGEAPGEQALADRTPNLWVRFMAGSAVIVAAMAAATAIAGLIFLSDVAADLRPIPGVQAELDEVTGDAQTILLIGSDIRPEEERARSDTTMLLRVDPGRDVLSLLSLPRDLKVQIPGRGVGKLNEAYANGGARRTLRAVKSLTGLEINHVVEIEFQGFADAVNAIDCVYVDVDRRYFHVNEGIGRDEDQFADIHINAGYRRLCGLRALEYVRYRHTDNDLVRGARQQSFLREARQKIKPRELLPLIGGARGSDLIDIFTDHTKSSIRTTDEIIKVLKSFIAVRDVPVNQIRFRGDIGDADSVYVTASDRQIRRVVGEFLEGTKAGDEAPDRDRAGGGRRQRDRDRSRGGPPEANTISVDELTEPGLEINPVEKRARTADRRVGFPVYYPEQVLPASRFLLKDTREYTYENDDDEQEEAYKLVFSRPHDSIVTEYYGIMGTTWEDPPILRNPSEVRTIGDRDYMLFYDGDRLRLAGWQEGGNAYWLQNSLLRSIDEDEMLAIISSMVEVER